MVVEELGAAAFVPQTHNLADLREAVQSCRGCVLYRDATQAVFGAGAADARMLLVGEQPGDAEDRAGTPFVGPAGRLLGRALADAEIDRDEVYLTNAVKHFKFVRSERGKRRIHQKPGRTEIVACWPWLAAELRVIRPELVVCLGATAAQSVSGPSFRLSRSRGVLLPAPGSVAREVGGECRLLATVHPSAVLRDPDRELAYQDLLTDLRVAARALRPTTA